MLRSIRDTPADPMAYGKRMGKLGKSYFPWLHFGSGQEWVKFGRGWKEGKREREDRELAALRERAEKGLA